MSTVKKSSYKDMTIAAIGSLKERNGSSIPSIVKYIVQTYGIDMEKRKIHLKRYLKKAVSEGEIIQTKGNGFNGSFKLPKISITTKSKPGNEKSNGNKGEEKVKKTKLAPKASAEIKVKSKLAKDASEKKSEGKKQTKDKNGKDKKSKDPAKPKVAKAKKDVNGKPLKAVLKRASLIGGAMVRKTTKKPASKTQSKDKIQSNVKK